MILKLKFVYSEKVMTKFCEISTLLLSTIHTDKIKMKILQKILAFSEYMNFIQYKFYRQEVPFELEKGMRV